MKGLFETILNSEIYNKIYINKIQIEAKIYIIQVLCISNQTIENLKSVVQK